MAFETLIGIVAGVLTSVSMVPQLVKVLWRKEVADLSWVMIGVLFSGVSLWVYYGVLKEEWPIILSNAFSALVNLTLLVCVFVYKKNG